MDKSRRGVKRQFSSSCGPGIEVLFPELRVCDSEESVDEGSSNHNNSLLNESLWRDGWISRLTSHIKAIVEILGVDSVNVEMIVKEVTPVAMKFAPVHLEPSVAQFIITSVAFECISNPVKKFCAQT